MRKALYVAALALWMLVVFGLSSQPFDAQNLRPWLARHLPEAWIVRHFSAIRLWFAGEEVSLDAMGVYGFIEFIIRKASHVLEYAMLGFLLYLFVRYVIRLKRFTVPLVLLACFVFAMSDEFHQSFVAGRHPLAEDVLLDTAGACIGVVLIGPAVGLWRMSARKIGRWKEHLG